MLKLMAYVSIETIDDLISAQIAALPVEKYTTLEDKKTTKIEFMDTSGDHDEKINMETEFKTKMPDKSVLQPETTYEDAFFSAFSGDSCPTGKAKIHGVCAEID